MSYFMAAGGGSAPYLDSVQIWVSTVDSTPSSFHDIILKRLQNRGRMVRLTQHFIPFDDFVGQNIWVAFRYYMDCTVDGYFVNLDDIEVA